MSEPCALIKLEETRPDEIKEKRYITNAIETSITVLGSPENNLVLESLLFLSKYADIQKDNLKVLQSGGLLPKLLALLNHNICILRLSLRLLAQLLDINAAKLQLKDCDDGIQRIADIFTNHPDAKLREFCATILQTYVELGNGVFIIQTLGFLDKILTDIQNGDSEILLENCIKMFNFLIELEDTRKALPILQSFDAAIFIKQLHSSEDNFCQILRIFEKITYFGDLPLLQNLQTAQVLEHLINILTDKSKAIYIQSCLTIILHFLYNANAEKGYFIQSLEFLKFCQWAKHCPDHAMLMTAKIFLELSKLDGLRQMLFDLSVENAVGSLLRSQDQEVTNVVFDTMAYMSKLRYCSQKLCSAIIVKRLLDVLGKDYATALRTLHYLCKRTTSCIYMINSYGGVPKLLDLLKQSIPSADKMKILDILTMLIANTELRNSVISLDFYEMLVIFLEASSEDVVNKTLEIMTVLLAFKDFRNYFLLNRGAATLVGALSGVLSEKTLLFFLVFLHNALLYQKLAQEFVHQKLVLALKSFIEDYVAKIPLLEKVIKLVYSTCLPIKYFETGRLDYHDKLTSRFYLLNGPWNECFPFLEVLELRQISTLCTIYVAEGSTAESTDKTTDSLSIYHQSTCSSCSQGEPSLISIDSTPFYCCINYGGVSADPYIQRYRSQIRSQVANKVTVLEKVKTIAQFVNSCLCGPDPKLTREEKAAVFKEHIASLKLKLGTNMIPIGFLRMGCHCERALLFKVLADEVQIPSALVRGSCKLCWNEVAIMHTKKTGVVLKKFIVDLLDDIGGLISLNSRKRSCYFHDLFI